MLQNAHVKFTNFLRGGYNGEGAYLQLNLNYTYLFANQLNFLPNTRVPFPQNKVCFTHFLKTLGIF